MHREYKLKKLGLTFYGSSSSSSSSREAGCSIVGNSSL